MERRNLYFIKSGFAFLFLTLFTLSFFRIVSLYLLAGFLVSGFLFWLFNYRLMIRELINDWTVIIAPVVYFLLHVFSILISQGSIILLEKKLMFLFVPLFGYPLLANPYFRSRVNTLFIGFISGILMISAFLVIRAIYLSFSVLPDETTLKEFINYGIRNLVSFNFSVFEHPSYFSLKIIFVFIIISMLYRELKLPAAVIFLSYLILSVAIVLLASKAGLIAWTFFLLYTVYISFKKKKKYRFAYLLFIPTVAIIMFFLGNKMERIHYFLKYTSRGLEAENFEWRNLDQRTREWYSAIQLISEKPITGHGIVNIEERMVKEYLKNDWSEEASLRLNAHNQYLEAQMTFGLAGTISLLFMLLMPVLIRKKLLYRELAVSFISLMGFYLFFESMFNRQWGIMFFIVFYMIFTVSLKNIPMDNNNPSVRSNY